MVLYRAHGAAAAKLLHEYNAYRHARRHGVPMMPLVVFGYGARQGRPGAALAYAWPEEYVPVLAWQAQRLYGTGRAGAGVRQAFADAVCGVMRALRRAHCFGLAYGETELLVRELGGGKVRVRLSGAARLRQDGLLARLLGTFWPATRMRRERDVAFVNRSHLREVF